MKKNDVYWWLEAPLAALEQAPVPSSADAVIVGAGYTGLSAAIRLARAGRSVAVFDSRSPGEGASTRNGGIASGNLRRAMPSSARRFGEQRAFAILAEAKEAREDLARFIADEKIDCDFALTGRFSGAAAPADYDGLAREADTLATRSSASRPMRCRGRSNDRCSGPISILAARCGWISAGCIRPSCIAACCSSRARPARRCTATPPSRYPPRG